MSCSGFEVDIIETLSGTAVATARARAEEHLRECANCRAAAAMWDRLGDMPEAIVAPPPALASRFRQRLAARGGAGKYRWMALAAALLLGAFGFLMGRYTAKAPAGDDMAGLRREVRNLKEVVALSLLDQQSASDRLRGIRYSTALDASDSEVLSALARTLRSDPSVDVRLAAADALRRYTLPEAIRESTWEILERDESPLVQVAVIDLLVAKKDPLIRARLEKLRGAGHLDSNVRDYLQAVLSNQRNRENSYQ